MFNSKKHKRARPLVFGLIALLTLFAADRVGSSALRAIVLQSDNRIARVYAGGRNDDVLISGASVANAMANPVSLSQSTGAQVFMAAVHGLDAKTQQALLSDYVARNQTPLLIILEIRPPHSKLVRAPEFGLFADDDSHMRALMVGERFGTVPWREVFSLYRMNSPLLPQTLQAIVDHDDQASGASDGRISPEIIASWRRTAGTGSVDETQLAAFVQTIKELEAAGASVVIVAAPLHPSARASGERIVRAVRAALPNNTKTCDFVDLFDADENFEDPTHLNENGRKAFSPFLAALIEEKIDASTPDANVEALLAQRCANLVQP